MVLTDPVIVQGDPLDTAKQDFWVEPREKSVELCGFDLNMILVWRLEARSWKPIGRRDDWGRVLNTRNLHSRAKYRWSEVRTWAWTSPFRLCSLR